MSITSQVPFYVDKDYSLAFIMAWRVVNTSYDYFIQQKALKWKIKSLSHHK